MRGSHSSSTFLSLVCMLSLCVLSAWSWGLIDPNLTLISHPLWAPLQQALLTFGRESRLLSSRIYMGSVCILATVHLTLIMRHATAPFTRTLTVLLACIAGVASYNALSHDLFNYIFDAKIVTYYHANPYLMRALDFPQDQSLRFMHWVHRTYPYGPTYLALSLAPSLLSGGKFLLAFLFFKGWYAFAYAHSVIVLKKIDARAALAFATAPLILVEGLMNAHNDFIGVWLGIVGFYFLHQRAPWRALVCMLASGLIKYFTLPLVMIPLGILLHQTLMRVDAKRYPLSLLARRVLTFEILTGISFVLHCMLIGYIWYTVELHAWYVLNLFVFVPYLVRMSIWGWPFFTGILLSYYPYVYGGDWGQGGDVQFKKNIQYQAVYFTLLWVTVVYAYRKLRPYHTTL